MNDYQLTLGDYLAIIRRRLWLIILSFAGMLVIGIAVTFMVPAVYRSTGSILIESQQIPTDFVQATVTSYADERIEVIKQRVMTRENLLGIIRKHKLFADAGASFTPSDQINDMRKTIQVELVSANLRADRQGPAAIAFNVSFEHSEPRIAMAVANDLVTLFLDENVKVRTQRAAQTTEFLTQESEKLKKELLGIESQIATYKQQNGRALPENLTFGVAALQRVEGDLRQLDRDYAATEEELRALELERSAKRPELAQASTNLTELQRAKVEVSRLSAVYTDDHPDLKAAKRRVEKLEQAASAEATEAGRPGGRGTPEEVALARFDARATMLRERLRVLAGQRATVRGQMAQHDADLVKLPQVERGLAVLARDYQAAQKKYEEIVAKKMSAQVSESLEGDQKAEKFALLEPPTLPDRPVKPDRKKLLALSLMLAMAVPAGMVSLAETLNGKVRGAGQIVAILGQKPLVSVPVIPVAAETTARRRMHAAAAGAAVLVVGAAIAAVHFFYLPLDLVVLKVLMRLG
ncbi:MAG: exopolysaccharide transport protein [Ramlibacter sp.]|nr:exopolysaccharide transport protein [Ramlibacter sp.]MDB5912874.1 exopolysaccharide transport protein [Ramlibacter sp.]